MEFSAFIDLLGWARNDYGYDVHVETCGFQKEVITASLVAFKLLELLTSKEQMEVVKNAMGFL